MPCSHLFRRRAPISASISEAPVRSKACERFGKVFSEESKELTSLHPIIVLKETNNGSGTQMRLVAGPLADAAAAARICAVLSENGRTCDTAIFDGQRLLEDSKDSDIALTTKKPKSAHASRRHSRKSTSAKAVDVRFCLFTLMHPVGGPDSGLSGQQIRIIFTR